MIYPWGTGVLSVSDESLLSEGLDILVRKILLPSAVHLEERLTVSQSFS